VLRKGKKITVGQIVDVLGYMPKVVDVCADTRRRDVSPRDASVVRSPNWPTSAGGTPRSRSPSAS
jgi:hypothetical protein